MYIITENRTIFFISRKTKTKITFQVVEDSIVLFLSKFDAKCRPLAKDDLYGYKIIVSAVKHIHIIM